MRKKKNIFKLKTFGFTLIELLAVILLLGIIGTIAVIKTLDIIKNSEKAAFSSSVEQIIKSLDNYLALKELRGEEVTGLFEFPDSNVELEYTGTQMTGGVILADVDDRSVSCITDGTYYASGTPGNLTISENTCKPMIIDSTCYDYDILTHTIVEYYPDVETCPLKDLILPKKVAGDNVKYIEDYAFSSYSLEGSLNLSNMTELVGIGSGAFANNKFGGNLLLGSLPNLTFIGVEAFYSSGNGFTGNLDLSGLKNLEEIGNRAFGANGFSGTLTFGELPKLTSINPDTFSGYEGGCDTSPVSQFSGALDLSGLTALTSIGSYAFNLNNIQNVIFPSSLQSIGERAFSNGILESLTIPNNVTTMEWGAFSDNHLTSVTLSDNLTSIMGGVFRNNQLTSITIPDSIEYIGNEAFRNNQLTSITIPGGVEDIVSDAFENNQITSLTIEEGVLAIYDGAFANNKISNLIIPTSITSIGAGAFNNNQLPDNQAFIYARDEGGSIDNTTLVSYGGAKRDNVVIPNGAITIGDSAFSGNKLTSVTIPDSVTTISYEAFVGNQLTSLTIPVNVTTIGWNAFHSYDDEGTEYDTNIGLITIANKTGRSFNWGSILNWNSGYAFATGSVIRDDGITVTVTN